jgi:hypothetical protein
MALGCLAYLTSRPDEFHASPLIILLAAACAPALAAVRPPSASRRRGYGLAAAALLGVLALYGLANRGSALLLPPDLARIDLPVADGAKAPPAEARALSQTVRLVQARVPPDRPIYTVTRRPDLIRFSQPLLYVLAGRDNPTRRDFGIQVSAPAQRRLTRELDRARPGAIVRWTNPITTVREPNLRGRPTGVRVVDRWLARKYRLAATFGDYQVLVPRARGSSG